MSSIKVPTWFWVVAVIALLWNLLGCMAYVMEVTKTEEAIAALPAAEQALYAEIPAWATAAFALAVFGGALGCVALLLRKSWAVPLFVVSLIALCIQMYHSLFMIDSIAVYGPGSAVMPAMVVLIAIALLVASRRWSTRGWLT
jgi:hypothetical protein